MSSNNTPTEIQFQLRDEVRGIEHPATEVTHIFEGESEPMGTDDGVVTIVVDMSEDGSRPVAASSLSSRFMVSDYNWTSEQKENGTFAKLSVNGVALQNDLNQANQVVELDKETLQPDNYLELLADIQRDAHNLSTRVALVKKSLENTDSRKKR